MELRRTCLSFFQHITHHPTPYMANFSISARKNDTFQNMLDNVLANDARHAEELITIYQGTKTSTGCTARTTSPRHALLTDWAVITFCLGLRTQQCRQAEHLFLSLVVHTLANKSYRDQCWCVTLQVSQGGVVTSAHREVGDMSKAGSGHTSFQRSRNFRLERSKFNYFSNWSFHLCPHGVSGALLWSILRPQLGAVSFFAGMVMSQASDV